jgi:PST family polysaccharide transporter
MALIVTNDIHKTAKGSSASVAAEHQNFFNTEHLKTDLKERSIRGGAVTMTAQVTQFLLQTGSTVVLARILTPADFGLIAMVTTVTGFAMMFSSLGLSDATIQKAEINHDQISTLFWINVGLGVLIAAVVIGLAPAVAWFYDEPRLTPVTMALGIAFIFGGLTVQHQAMLQRHMRFFAIGIVEVVSMAVGVGAAIVAGVLGAGYWSLVIMNIAMAVAAAVGKWVVFPWLPGWPRKGVGVRKMLGFGGNITGFNIVNYFSRNADNILIGKFLGSTSLGFYSKAYGLLMLPVNQIRSPLISVGLPSLSRLQGDPERYKNYYLKMIQLLAFITVPMAILLGAYSHQIIILVLGPQWEQAAGIFSILAFAAVIQPVASTYGMVMISAGHTARYFKLGVFTSIAYVISFAAGLPWGTSGVALGYTIANYILLVPMLMYAFSGTPVRVRDFFKAIFLPCAAALIMVLASRVVFYFCTVLTAWLALVISLLTAGLFYLVAYLILPRGRTILHDIKTSGQMIFKSAKEV